MYSKHESPLQILKLPFNWFQHDPHHHTTLFLGYAFEILT